MAKSGANRGPQRKAARNTKARKPSSNPATGAAKSPAGSLIVPLVVTATSSQINALKKIESEIDDLIKHPAKLASNTPEEIQRLQAELGLAQQRIKELKKI